MAKEEQLESIKVLRTTIASGVRIIRGAITEVSASDARYLKGIKKARDVEDGDVDEPVEEVVVSTGIDPERLEALINAVMEVDDNNDALWTTNGAPKVSAVKAIIDGDVSADEVEAAWSEINKD